METANGSKNGASTNVFAYRFDEFEIDTANRTLLRGGINVPMTAKVFDLLLVFAQNPGRLLEKNELIERLWQKSFVEEGNLARNVSTLRKTLGDIGKEHKYIATVQGRGYRFLANVEAHQAQPLAAPAPPVQKELLPVLRQRSWLVSLSIVILLALLFIFMQSGVSPTKPVNLYTPENIRQTKLTQDGNVVSPAISRDGQYLAYLAIGQNQALCVRQISTGSVLAVLPAHSEIWNPLISPDNSFIYYLTHDEDPNSGQLYRVPLLGGTPHKIAAVVDAFAIAPDGGHIALIRRDRQAGTASIITANNDGFDERNVLSLEYESVIYALDWSPDGQDLLFSVRRSQAATGEWYVAEISLAGGGERRVPQPVDTHIMCIKWLPDKSGFIAIATDPETRRPQLYHLSYQRGDLRRLTSDVDGIGDFTMTSDGRTLVASHSQDDREISVMDWPASGVVLPVAGGTQKHFDSVSWLGNDHLVFDEDANSSYGNRNIWRMRPDGSEALQLTSGDGNNTMPTGAPDGSSIVFVSKRSGKYQLWRMTAEGRDPTQLTDLPYEIYRPHFSADGRTVFFDTWVDGKYQIWQIALTGGDISRVVDDSDVYLWSVAPDGLKVAYCTFDQPASKVVTKIRQIDRAVPDRVVDFLPESWILWENGSTLLVNSNADTARNIWKADLTETQLKPATNLPDKRIFDCNRSPDGTRLACIRQAITYDAVRIKFE